MSLLQRNPVLVGIGLREVVAVEQPRGGRGRVLAVAPLDPALSGGMPDVRNWAAPLRAVMGALGKGGRAQVTLSDDWARYWCVKPPAGLGSFMELRALAQARFDELFGGPVSAWHIEADWRASTGTLACAIPAALIESLIAAAVEAGVKLVAVEPAATRWYNRHASDMQSDCWFCSFGERSVCAVAFMSGEVTHVRQFRFDLLPDAGEMVVRLESESLRQGFAMPNQVYYAGQAPAGPVVAAPSGVAVTVLGRQAPAPEIARGGGVTPEACQLAFAGWQS